MSEPTGRVTSPVEVRLDLTGDAAGALARLSCEERLGADIRLAFSGLLDVLGIPGPVEVVVQTVSDLTLPGGRFMRLHVNGHVCRFSNDILQSAHSYTTGRLLDLSATPEFLQRWLGKDASGAAYCEFVTVASVEAAKLEAGILLTRARVSEYLACIPKLAAEDSRVLAKRFDVYTILRDLLNLRLSLVDLEAIRTVFCDPQNKDHSVSSVVESLIEALRPNRIELRMPLRLMRELTTKWGNTGPEMFRFLREGLFNELGILYPPFEFVACEELKPGTFTFTINHLTVSPCIALQPSRLLVNTTLKNFTGLDVELTANPATRHESVVTSSSREWLEAQRLVVWDAMQYFILWLAAVLRTHGECFIDRRTVQASLEVLEPYSPSLVNAVRLILAEEYITHTVRGLAAEQVPLRHLRQILEAMLKCDDQSATDAFLEAARGAMQRHIAERHARGSSTIDVYLFDQAIETELAHEVGYVDGEGAEEMILAAVRKELDDLARQTPNALTPHLLTRPELRLRLRRLVVREFPRLSVLSFAEIPATTNIRPVARIAFS